MASPPQHARYVLIFAAIMGAVLLPVLVLNYVLGMRSLGGDAAVVSASQWQQATRGVTYAPPLSANRPFKSARLFARLPEINTVIFGSSTAMGVTQAMFPDGMSIYNFAQTGNPLATVIAEAEFLQRTQAGPLKWFVLPLDWALGFVYQPAAPGTEKLAPPATDAPAQRTSVALAQQLHDALSLPRIKNLFNILRDIVRAPSPAAALRQIFMQDSSDDYRCVDGTPAKDFDTIFRGTCTGFRYDGSATFANLDPVPARGADALIASAVVASSKYVVEMARTGGEPNPLLLERIGMLNLDMKRTGGNIVLFLPPLLPGMERAFLSAAHTAVPLRRTKHVLDTWARAHELIIIDAGQSERFGCVAHEFVDAHHALPACYARIFERFWKSRARASPGLWVGDQQAGNF